MLYQMKKWRHKEETVCETSGPFVLKQKESSIFIKQCLHYLSSLNTKRSQPELPCVHYLIKI